MSTTIKLALLFCLGTLFTYVGFSHAPSISRMSASFRNPANEISSEKNLPLPKKALRMPSKMTSQFSPVVSAEEIDPSIFRLRVEELDILSNPNQAVQLQWHLKENVELLQGSLMEQAIPEQLIGTEILVRVNESTEKIQMAVQQIALEVYYISGSDKIGSTTQPILQTESQTSSSSDSSESSLSMKSTDADFSEEASKKPAKKIHY